MAYKTKSQGDIGQEGHKQKVLVIGGSGFLGYHLVKELVESKHEVTVMDIMPKDSATKLKEFKDINYIWKSAIDISEQDVKDKNFVINLAAQADVPLSNSSPRYTWIQNTEAVMAIMDVLKSNTQCKFIFMSAGNVYGGVKEDKVPITEEQQLRPTNVYAASKASAELLINAYAEQFNISAMILRSAGLYGENMREKQVVSAFIKQALKNSDITVEGDGSQRRDFNYVKNAVFAITQAMKSDKRNGTWNISDSKEISVKELAELIIKLTNSKSKIVETPWRTGERGLRLWLSIEKARKELDYEPKYSMENGLKSTIEWLKRQ